MVQSMAKNPIVFEALKVEYGVICASDRRDIPDINCYINGLDKRKIK